MSRYVLDSFALLAFFQQERGWQMVRELIKGAEDGSVELYMSAINMAEVKYMLSRRGKNSPQIMAAIEALPINITSADEYIDQVVALKTAHAVSLADCFGASVAIRFNCPIVTADPEFEKLEPVVKVEWLR